MPLKIKKILKGLVLLVCVSYWESFTFNFICGLLQIPGTNHIMKSCSWDIGCVLLMLKEDPLREPLSGGEKERKREEGERQIEGEKAKREEGSELQDRERREGRERKDREEGRAAAVKLHFILTDLLYTLISLLKKRKWHSIRRNPFLLEQVCQLRDEWIQAELSSSG